MMQNELETVKILKPLAECQRPFAAQEMCMYSEREPQHAKKVEQIFSHPRSANVTSSINHCMPVHWVHRASAANARRDTCANVCSVSMLFPCFVAVKTTLKLFVQAGFVRSCEANAPVAPSPAPEMLTQVTR